MEARETWKTTPGTSIVSKGNGNYDEEEDKQERELRHLPKQFREDERERADMYLNLDMGVKEKL